jgi:hypothetical protein
VITESATIPSVAASCGSRRRKRIRPSSATAAPVTITSPWTSSALARIEPTSELCATSSSPEDSAKMTMKSSGRLPREAWARPVTSGPKRVAACSVPSATTQARPASANDAAAKAATALASE